MLSSLKRANEILQDELDQYHRREKELQKKEAQFSQAQEEIEKLKQLLEEANKKNETVFIIERDLKDSQTREQNLQNTVKVQQEELGTLRGEFAKLKQLEEDLQRKNNEYSQLLQQLQQMQKREQELMEKQKRGEELSQQEQDELNRLRALLKEKEDEIERLKRELEALRKSQMELGEKLKIEEQMKNEIERLKSELQMVHQQLKKRESDLLQSENQKIENENKNKDLNLKFKKQEEQIKDLQFQIISLKQQHSKIIPAKTDEQKKILDIYEKHQRKVKIFGIFVALFFFFSLCLIFLGTISSNWNKGYLLQVQKQDNSKFTSDRQTRGVYNRGLWSTCKDYQTGFNIDVLIGVKIPKCGTRILTSSSEFSNQLKEIQSDFNESQYTLSSYIPNLSPQNVENSSNILPKNISQIRDFIQQKFFNKFLEKHPRKLQSDYESQKFDINDYKPKVDLKIGIFTNDGKFPSCDSTSDIFIPMNNFKEKQFEGCHQESEVEGIMYLARIFSLITCISITCIFFIALTAIISPSSFGRFLKYLIICIIIVVVFGFITTIVYASKKSEIFSSRPKNLLYGIDQNDTELDWSFTVFTIGWILPLLIVPVLGIIHKILNS